MKAKIIFRPKTDDADQLNRICKQLEKSSVAVVPESMKLMIVDRDGFWTEVGKRKMKLGDLELEE